MSLARFRPIAGGRMPSNPRLRYRSADLRLHRSTFSCKQSEKGETSSIVLTRRLDRLAREYGEQLTMLEVLRYRVGRRNAYQDDIIEYNEYDQEHCTSYNFRSSVDAGNRNDCLRNKVNQLTKRCDQIGDWKNNEKKKHKRYESTYNMYDKERINDKPIAVDYRNTKTIKTEVEIDKLRIINLERENKYLKCKMETKDAKISDLTKLSYLKRNIVGKENTKNGNAKLHDLESKNRENVRNIEDLKRQVKAKEDRILKETERYSDLFTDFQKLKTDFEKSITSLQTTNQKLETDISCSYMQIQHLENELKICKEILDDKNTNETLEMKHLNQTTMEDMHTIEHTKLLSAMRLECHEKSQRILDLERQLNETLRKRRNKDEEKQHIGTTHQQEEDDFKAENSWLRTRYKNQEDELIEVKRNLRVKIEGKDRQLHKQREEHQEALKQLQKSENELLKTIDSQRKEIQHLKEELHASQNALSNLDNSIQIKAFETNTNEAKAEADQRRKIAELKKQLEDEHSKLKKTENELDDTKSRLSKVMGDRLTDNNPNITDLNDSNRPTKLAEKYAELYDNQWTDAFDYLEKHYKAEEYVIHTLLQILQDVMTFCCERADLQMKNLGIELLLACKDEDSDVPADVRKHFKECRKATGLITVGNLQKIFHSHLEKSTNEKVKTALKVRAFTAACVEICWFMVIQDPQVAFAPLPMKGSNFDTDFYKPYTTSGPKVEFVVWPPLLLHKGGPILAKGVAQGIGKTAAT